MRLAGIPRALADRAQTKAGGLRRAGALRGRLTDLLALVRLLRANRRGDYRQLPRRTVLLAVAALAYFVIPVDLIPDFIPIAGYIDDAVVIGWILASIRDDLDRFRQWEERRRGAQ